MDQPPPLQVLPPPRPGFVARLSGRVARHPQACLAVIVVLLVVLAWTLVRYRGVFGLGGGACKPRAGKKKGGSGDAPAEKAKDDAQVDSLVAAINVNVGAT